MEGLLFEEPKNFEWSKFLKVVAKNFWIIEKSETRFQKKFCVDHLNLQNFLGNSFNVYLFQPATTSGTTNTLLVVDTSYQSPKFILRRMQILFERLGQT
jgi:hypothetical protein